MISSPRSSAFEDRLTELLAREDGRPATPMTRLHAIQLVGIVRTTTSPERRESLDPAAPHAGSRFEQWLHTAARSVETAQAAAGG